MWRYYNHALIPRTPPHQSADVSTLVNNPLWKEKRVLFARWTSDYDLGYETSWWYCIKDEPFDINNINAKKRYEINKGKKNFEVKIINPSEHTEDLYEIFIKAMETYGGTSSYDRNKILKSFVAGPTQVYFGAFFLGDNRLCGYAILDESSTYIKYVTHKAIPSYESKAVNAAIVNAILEYYTDKLSNGIYICDGERNVYHETSFQSYLEKYFGFRKAYCRLNIKYKSYVKLAVNFLYPFRKIIYKIQPLSKVGGVLKMHELYKKECKI